MHRFNASNEPAMRCSPAACQCKAIAPFAGWPLLRNVAVELWRIAQRVASWWQGRMTPARPSLHHLSATRDLSDHVLRDIGYLDTLPPREAARREDFY